MAKSTPLQFDVPDIHCQSCIDSITQAVHRVEAEAEVTVDLDSKRVVIGGDSDVQDFMKAVEDAGFEVKAAV